jgi:hypothetical protein
MSEKKPTLLERVKQKVSPVVREVNRVGRIVTDAIAVQESLQTLRKRFKRDAN